MLIYAIDPAVNTGLALGEASALPRIERIRLKKPHEDAETAAANMACLLRDEWTFATPDLVVIEAYLNPAGHKSADAAIIALAIHFTVTTMCITRGIPWRMVYPATWRVHLLGKAYAGEKKARGTILTPKQRAEKRDATKQATLQRVKLLGYLPPDCTDADKADAAGLWDYAAHTFGRRAPAELVMHGARA
jgi:hypothetical protein